MSQDNKKSMVMYQGDGSNNVFAVPMTKGKYGTISVAFVRRGLDNYEYNPTTWTLNDENTLLTWTGDVLNVGDYIVIERTTARKQPYEFPNNQKHIERSDDNLERQIQEVADAADRALKLDPTYSIDSDKMNPIEWLQTIVRCKDLTVRGLRFANNVLQYSKDDPEKPESEKTWYSLLDTDGITNVRERYDVGTDTYYFEYSTDGGSNWKDVGAMIRHNVLQGRDEADCHPISAITGLQDKLDEKLNTESAEETYATKTELSSHTENTDNPHNVTKAQVGLGNVDNTSDLSKPISTATQNALNGKLSIKQNPQDAGKIVKVGSDGNLELSSESSGGGLQSVSHGATLKGAGTDSQPLDVADGAIGNTQLAQEVKQEIAGKQPAGNYATESDINTLQRQIDYNSKDIEALQGAGGALTAYNFNTATPTQETLTKYAVDQIWPGNTNWAWNAANPAASTFTDANGVARTAAEIFNSTWVNNTYDDHRWQLTNTQNTEPKVFEWADVGRDIVSIATATTAGIVRVGDGSQMVVNPATGDISLDGTKAAAIRSTIDAPGLNVDNTFSGAFQTLKLTNLNFSTTVATAQYAGINFNDASGVRLGVVELSQQVGNTKRMSVGLVGSTIRFNITSDGVASQMLSANPPSDSSSTQIATTQWVKKQLLNIGATMVPDYSRGVGIKLPYTVPENGWVYVEVFTQEKYVNVQVNGQIVVEVGGSNNSRTPIPFFCLKGDVIRLNVDNESAGGRFFPCKVLESAPATVYKVVNSANSDTYYLSDKPFGLDDINNTEYLSSIKLYSVNNRYRLFNYVVTADSAAGMILIKKPDGTTDTNSLGGQGAGFYAQEVAV